MRRISFALIGALVTLTIACSDRPAPEANAAEAPTLAALEIPQSMRAEHEEIHATLEEATRVEGAVGAAARELAAVLDPHFVRENQIALPPLGLLSPLAAGAAVPAAIESQALAMSDSLKSELPRMLQEHGRIRAAVATLRAAAQAAGAVKYEQFAEELALHAQTEEEVNYPAAVLVGEILRSRGQGGR